MKLFLAKIFCFLFSINCYCQSLPEDYVITLNKDTIYGNIEIKNDMGGYIKVVLRKNNTKKKYDRYTILAFRKDGKKYETLNVEEFPELYCKLIEGELTLYYTIQMGGIPGGINGNGGGTTESKKYYFQRKGKKAITFYNHKELAGIFLDYNDLYLKILNKEITDIEFMVKSYNDWCTLKK